jgi:hypothetical protein
MPITGNAQPSNRSQPKKIGPNKQSHTSNTKYGMGDNYGTGIKQKLGTMREDSMGLMSITPKKLRNPPKSLA